jgi:predicted Rossmann fold flavoprotein
MSVNLADTEWDVVIVGAGAAGVFAAAQLRQSAPHLRVVIIESGLAPLQKVRISGGGRCNVTHACFDTASLLKHYPRGGKWLRGTLGRFGPQATIDWFASHGVALKTEADGRLFPNTDSSQTIIDCLLKAIDPTPLCLSTRLHALAFDTGHWHIKVQNTQSGSMANVSSRCVLVATGSNAALWKMLQGLGQPLVAPVPSLFTATIDLPWLHALSGISVPDAVVRIKEDATILPQQGPLLITHWGLSGPAMLKLSAWGARALHGLNYQATLHIDWLPALSWPALTATLNETTQTYAKRQVGSHAPVVLPKQLWKSLAEQAGLNLTMQWAHVSKSQLDQLQQWLKRCPLPMTGKGTFKEEFVTAGGVELTGVDSKTMASKTLPGLYFAGEILDVDGVTGGFNFQHAWSSAFAAATALAS